MYKKLGKNALVFRLVKGVVISTAALVILSFGFLLAGLVGIFIGVLIPLVLLTEVLMFLEYANSGFMIDENSVSLKQGMFSLERVAVPFPKITNTSFKQSFFQRLFSVGDLEIDQEDATVSLDSIDNKSAEEIMGSIKEKSHIQTVKL